MHLLEIVIVYSKSEYAYKRMKRQRNYSFVIYSCLSCSNMTNNPHFNGSLLLQARYASLVGLLLYRKCNAFLCPVHVCWRQCHNAFISWWLCNQWVVVSIKCCLRLSLMSLRNGQHAMLRRLRAMTGRTPMMNECSQDSEALASWFWVLMRVTAILKYQKMRRKYRCVWRVFSCHSNSKPGVRFLVIWGSELSLFASPRHTSGL
jgi:hypothetical protein